MHPYPEDTEGEGQLCGAEEKVMLPDTFGQTAKELVTFMSLWHVTDGSCNLNRLKILKENNHKQKQSLKDPRN